MAEENEEREQLKEREMEDWERDFRSVISKMLIPVMVVMIIVLIVMGYHVAQDPGWQHLLYEPYPT